MEHGSTTLKKFKYPTDDEVQIVCGCHLQDYRSVVELLNCGVDPNSCLNFQLMWGTGLEYSLLTNDRTLAIIFFVHGANPNENSFDGILYLTEENPIELSVFVDLDVNFIPGFKGLYALVNPSSAQSTIILPLLYVMEHCHRGTIDVEKDFNIIVSALNIIDLEFDGHELRKQVIMVLLSTKCYNIPSEVQCVIVEHFVLSNIWFLLETEVKKYS